MSPHACFFIVLVALFRAPATPAAPAEPAPLDVEAERLDFDRKAGVARFEGDVRARQGDLELRCQRLVATYGADGQVEMVTIEGGLTLSAEGLTARAAQAVFRRSTGELLLTGQPELTRGTDVVAGESIRLWPETGRVVVEKARGRVSLPRLQPPALPGLPSRGR